MTSEPAAAAGHLVEVCSDIVARRRAFAVDVEAILSPAERRELVELALAGERLALAREGGPTER